MGIFESRPKRAVSPPRPGWDPETWATRFPLKYVDNFAEVFRAGWENRDRAGHAWRILKDGACDGCALDTSGMSDWTVDGVHLCTVRLRLLRLNTLPEADPARFEDVAALQELRSHDLRAVGRLPHPMIRRRGEPGFRSIGWDDALDRASECIRATHPDRTFLYLTSRGIPNETYYVAQKAMRAIGTKNVDNAARVCHSPSTVALKAALSVGATTRSCSDLIGTDLITFLGSNVAKNQPVVMKYLYHAKKAGTKVVTINPYREPGMDAYWVPSDLESALFGTKITDRFVHVGAGGDRAFLHGTLKALIEEGDLDERFIDQHTTGFEDLHAIFQAIAWEELERAAGVPRAEMEAYAGMIIEAERAVFVWGMGITQHTSGEDNVRPIIDLALAKGFVGRDGCGLMPIRGHSGVQDSAEMGACATAFPGGAPITADSATALSDPYGFDVPARLGLTTPGMLDAARAGEIDALLAVGGNVREVMPDPSGVDEAFARIPLRVHIDIVPSSQMLVDPADVVLLLPAITRHEVPGAVTQTSTERRIVFSPAIPGPRVPEARPEWTIFGELAARVRPDRAGAVRFGSTAEIREEIARVVPMYDGIQDLRAKGDQVQYGGPLLCAGGVFPTSDARARFHAVRPFPTPQEGERVRVESEHRALHGHVVPAEMAPGAIQLYWPEANVLLSADARSTAADIPAY